MHIIAANKNIVPSGTGKSALESLLPGERPFIEAALNSKIKDLPPGNVVNELVTILTTLFTIAGQKSEPATLAIYADEFYQKLRATYPCITIEEIRAALKKGVYDELGEYFGLNVKTFVSFVRAYLNSEERKAAKEKFEARLLSTPSRELTQEQKEQAKKEFVNQLYADFLQGRLITDYIPSYLCRFLEEKRLIVLTNEEKKEIKDRARSYYTRLAAQGRFQVEVMKISAHANMEAIEPDIRISNIARQFAIYEFFERCKAQGARRIFDDVSGN